jgi:hypothetical protein
MCFEKLFECAPADKQHPQWSTQRINGKPSSWNPTLKKLAGPVAGGNFQGRRFSDMVPN